MDAFGGFGFDKNPDKMTLAERQRAQQLDKQRQSQQWSQLDSLGGASGRTSGSTSGRTSGQGFDLLGDFAPSAASSVASSRSKPRAAASVTSTSLLDEFDVFASAPPAPAKPASKSSPTDSASSETAPKQASQPIPAPQNPMDPAVAQLVDMGFSDRDSMRALEAMDGSVNGAINYLMREAQGKPLPKPKKSQQDEVIAMAQDVGTQVYAAASSWFSKGKKQLQKTIDGYHGSVSSDQPAWMRSQEKHIARERRELDLPERPRQREESRRNEFDLDLPSRPRRESPAASPAPAAATAPTERQKSRAELFRERQGMRGSPISASPMMSRESPASTRSATPANTQPSAPAPAPATAAASAPAPPDIDLLGISAPASHSLSSTAQDMMGTARTSGTMAFKRGDYSGAATYFTSALQTVPAGHVLRVVLLSNRSAALLKVGDAPGALVDIKEAFTIIPAVVKKDDKTTVEDGKPLSDIWVKLVVRQAQAYEHLEKYPEALVAWKLLLDNGYSQPTYLEGKRRCLTAINQKAAPAAAAAAPAPTKRRGWGTTGAGPQSAEGKAAVEKVRQLNHKQEQTDKERADLLVQVSERVDRWKAGKETDLRALLSSLHTILWAECQWQPVQPADLVSPKKARIVYMKAVARTHPDKIPGDATTEIKMVSESVFIVLNGAWETFRASNGL